MENLLALPDDQLFADYAQVKAQVSIAGLLAHYGVTAQSSGENFKFACPFHAGASLANCSMHKKTGHFQCFSPACKAKGNVLDFVAKMQNCSVPQAAVFLAKLQGIPALTRKDSHPILERGKEKVSATPLIHETTPGAAKPIRSKEKEQQLVNPPLQFALKYLDATHPYGLARGLSTETIQTFGCGVCASKSLFAGRYLIPLHNPEGELIGYAGRRVKEEGDGEKWLLPPSDKGFCKTKMLFNLHRVRERFSATDPVWLVENPFAAMLGFQLGFPVLATLGAHLSEWQAATLTQHFRLVHILFDGDDAGRQGADKAVLLIARSAYVRIHHLADGAQPDTLPLAELNDLLQCP